MGKKVALIKWLIVLSMIFLGLNYFFQFVTIEFYNGLPYAGAISVGLIILGVLIAWLIPTRLIRPELYPENE